MGADNEINVKDALKIMVVLMENLFFNIVYGDALLLAFYAVKESIEKMDMDTEEGIEFLTKLYLVADNRRKQNFLSRM